MAINYTNLFEDLGEFVERVNQFRTIANTDLPAMLTEIQTELSGNSMFELLSGIPQMFDAFKDSIIGMALEISSKAQERLLDRDTILDELAVVSPDINAVLADLFFNMSDLGHYVTPSVPTVPTEATANGGNAGNGTLVLTSVLDGYNAPVLGSLHQYFYWGETSQFIVPSETMDFRCISDTPSNGVPVGDEVFTWLGAASPLNAFDWRNEGSGLGPQITSIHGSINIVSGGGFEDWTANVPNGWTINTGSSMVTEGTASVYLDDSAMLITGDGSDLDMDYSIASQVTPGRRYCIAVYMKCGAAVTITGNFVIGVRGTAFTEAVITKNQAELRATSAAYTRFFGFITIPFNIPDDLEVYIDCDDMAAGTFLVDGLAMGPLTYHGGIGAAILRGSTEFSLEDRFSVAISQDQAGLFQEFFRRYFKFQLPTSGGGTLFANALCTD